MVESAGLPLAEPGLWVERTSATAFPVGRPALFLDRDGTINVDTDYPSDPAEIALRPQMLPVIETANQVGAPVVIVTNQSGIARGYFGWDAFAAVNRGVLDLLARSNAVVDMVLACGYHEKGTGALAVADHPMRKPNPGMLLEAGRRLSLDLERSLIVGDKLADMEAGQRAGLERGWLVDGEGSTMDGLSVLPLRNATDLGGLLTAIRSL
ncbi:HAD family hydrolase [Mesorhizobium sp. M2D.F.Ca.ET.185.01.1.1]|uniref:D-glycero-alpha-D-manno-heptose-1,7-bisphosphate 7-phosphatase n=2 Tax=Mesorhizobium TaxID=68287 RepID=UPI000FCB62E8|nr:MULTISPECIES: HAD family hydrolase [unclassified Mesorhizobium]TGP82379.1 HAD family hydrolase [bacterium M00.F.Ca.ET.227.01.1.1]TGP94133.1 HAD family hydrolase [bacterium M00.F.Ca.ET.221.01.1.1]TGP97586.1 HAD family hydrolase [bacterium M00.F.Ca.ET.222.01.1.1]TGU12102.1 HAD family hydrolase [bacterium M00.F.Ca.ET.163.01.1.1]TGU35641.1 HAD family hydrolase [bacterium M00.F.Ca.ET.156.01.1.1]TGU48568.1 HAD family hydrolase [bacterium M00.F.Ca.ET.146.01.1.1]TGV70370.1 HAD family hydrolase [M